MNLSLKMLKHLDVIHKSQYDDTVIFKTLFGIVFLKDHKNHRNVLGMLECWRFSQQQRLLNDNHVRT